MIKIVFILPLWGFGGTEKVMSLVADHIDKTKFNVVFIVLNEQKRNGYKPCDSSIRIIDLKVRRVATSILKLRQKLMQEKPDIIVSSQSHLNLYLTFFKKFGFLRRRCLIIRESTILSISSRINNSHRWLNYLTQYCYPAADHIICQSEYMENDLRDNYNIQQSKMTVINNPVDTERIMMLKKAFIPPYDKSVHNIVAVGRMTQDKGFDLLLDAISLMKNDKVHFFIIGDGRDRDKLIEITHERGIEDMVSFPGMLRNPYPYISEAELLVSSSRYEGFPNVILEAGALGTPVVAFNCPGGTREIIRKGLNGFLAEDGDVEDLSRNIIKAINYSFNKEQVMNYTKNTFGLDKKINEYEQLFDSVLQAGRI